MGKAITISREHGCGGIELGKALAESLGYEYIDKSIVVDLAKKMKTSQGMVSSLEDGDYLSLFKFINKFVGESTIQTIVRVNCRAERYCRRTLPIMLALQRLSDMIMLVFIGWSWSGENAICILRS